MTDTYTNPSGNLSLRISEDKLSAWLTVHTSGKLINERDILDLIDRAGIKYGFEDALRYIRAHNLEKDFDQPFPVAMCKTGGSGNTIKRFFDVEQARAFNPRVTPEQIPSLTCVEAGTVLADLSDNIFDREGSIYNVLGEMIAPTQTDLDAATAMAGENVSYLPEKGQFVSVKSGYIALDDEDRVSVHSTLIIQGDLEGVQDLRAPVDLIVEGSIRGSGIHLQGGLSVSGDIYESGISCGGDLLVGGEIRSCRQGGLEVIGDLRCGRIISSRVLCRGLLSCSEIRSSEVVGEKGISTQADGPIIASNAQSAVRIEAGHAGEADDESETVLEITISPFLKALMMHLTRELVHAKQNGRQEEVKEIAARISTCEHELDRELNDFLVCESDQLRGVKIIGNVYPVLKVRVLKHEYKISKYQSGLSIDEKQ
ncbi:MAG TPA: FapA family protein [Candidatus Cloacimonadota bacterium]|nr:FapA family protein [Candidatus Cloacimonadota bacterium]